MVEPGVACPRCKISCSLEEGTSAGMRCQRCGGGLVPVRSEWFAGDVEADSRGGNGHVGFDQAVQVAELQLPAHNEVDAEAVGQFITSLPVPLALEIYGEGDRRALLVRGEEDHLRFLAGNVQTLWPSAALQVMNEDPVARQGGSRNGREHGFSFRLGTSPYLPIRTWESFLRGDPMHTLLATALGLTPGERVWLQIMISRKGKPPWLESVQRRLKLEAQRGYLINPDGASPGTAVSYSQAPIPHELTLARGAAYLLVVLLGMAAVVVGLQGSLWLLAAFSLPIVVLGGLAWRFLGGEEDPWREADLRMVREKVVDQDAFYLVTIRASVRAHTYDRAKRLAVRIDRAMSQYARAGGNGLEVAADPFESAGPWIGTGEDSKNAMWLSPDEVAGLWHPPLASEQMSPGLVPVRGVEMRSPDPEDVRGFYPIGRYFTSDGGSKPVHISSAAMQHNLFCIGKPGAGKSTLMHHLCAAGMRDDERPAVIVIDPHGDLVSQIIGSTRDEDIERVRILDVTDKEFVLTFNPLNVRRAGWGAIDVVNSVVDIGRSLWSDYWGPRMQIPLKRGVQMLAAANELRPADDCLGLSQLAAILTAHHEVRDQFLRTELEGSPHRKILARYFLDDYEDLTRHFKEQVISPVLSKAYRFEEEPMLALFSCPESRLDIGETIHDRRLLLINTGMNKYGSELSDFVGSLIINVMLRELVHQGERSPGSRVPVMLVIDEFQTFTGVAWAELIQQMRKYGGRMVLGTQSMASLRKQDRNIPEIILSGVYSMFAFTMNGDDAEYMSRLELSGDRGGPTADTLISLEPYKAYVRLEREDGRLSRPFYFESDPPPEQDSFIAEKVWNRRSEYSLPYEVAYQKALDMVSYFDRYGATVLSTGAGARTRKKEEPATSTQAAFVLLDKVGAELAAIEEEARVGLPWEDEGEEEARPEERTPSGEAGDVVLGKEIAEDWRRAALREIEQDDEGQGGEADT